MSLKEYKAKRDFEKTSEPSKAKKSDSPSLSFCVQKHAARSLHYDFRLECRGVLISWAVPKGPSLNPQDKRLAIKVEDHPLDYQHFEGVIPKGNYGAGTVEIWDAGTYTTPHSFERKEIEKEILAGLDKGHFAIILHGGKLNGEFVFQKLKNDEKDNQWLLIKKPEKSEKMGAVKAIKGLTLTHLDKIYWPEEKYTKGDLLAYYEKVAPFILPYLKNRPIMLHRFPDGINGKDFYQKDINFTHPEWIKTFPIKQEGSINNYLLINDVKSLLYAVNLGSIDLHPFLSNTSNLDHPDFCIIDLDPHDISFDKVIEAALELHHVLEAINVKHYCKTSGGKGLHIMIPLHAKYDYTQSRQFAESICHQVNRKLPKTTSMERSPEKRPKMIYLDCLQNRFGQSIVSPYAVRPRPKAMVSTPLSWEEVNDNLVISDYTIQTVPARLEKIGDILKPVLGFDGFNEN